MSLRNNSGNFAILTAIRRASSAVKIQLLLFGFGRQKPNNYCCREHEGPRNQMISRKVHGKLGYMLCQKRQAAKR